VLIPGLIETHCHISDSEGLQQAVGVINASYEAGVRSLSDIFSKIQESTRMIPKDIWIDVVQEDDSRLVEKRHPQKSELDEISPDHPVMVTTVGGHFAIVNSKVFEASLDPVTGAEQKGRRPVLVVSDEEFNQAMPNVTVLPLTSTKRQLYPSEVLLPGGKAGQSLESIVMAHQIRTISFYKSFFPGYRVFTKMHYCYNQYTILMNLVYQSVGESAGPAATS